MRVAITIFVDSQEEAKETLAALNAINALPWRQSVFGVGPKVPTGSAVISSVVGGGTELEEVHNEAEQCSAHRDNTEPPGTATKAIKSATEQKLADLLVRPHPIEHIKSVLKAPKEHCENLLRLLWERGKIKYDGKNYQNSER